MRVISLHQIMRADPEESLIEGVFRRVGREEYADLMRVRLITALIALVSSLVVGHAAPKEEFDVASVKLVDPRMGPHAVGLRVEHGTAWAAPPGMTTNSTISSPKHPLRTPHPPKSAPCFKIFWPIASSFRSTAASRKLLPIRLPSARTDQS